MLKGADRFVRFANLEFSYHTCKDLLREPFWKKSENLRKLCLSVSKISFHFPEALLGGHTFYINPVDGSKFTNGGEKNIVNVGI